MADQPHSKAVLDVLAGRLHSNNEHVFVTPFGVKLHTFAGRYSPAQTVMAPGVDDCSPREAALVLACGTRADHDGVWYLLRFAAGRSAYALVEESDLREPPPATRFRPHGSERRERSGLLPMQTLANFGAGAKAGEAAQRAS